MSGRSGQLKYYITINAINCLRTRFLITSGSTVQFTRDVSAATLFPQLVGMAGQRDLLRCIVWSATHAYLGQTEEGLRRLSGSAKGPFTTQQDRRVSSVSGFRQASPFQKQEVHKCMRTHTDTHTHTLAGKKNTMPLGLVLSFSPLYKDYLAISLTHSTNRKSYSTGGITSQQNVATLCPHRKTVQ